MALSISPLFASWSAGFSGLLASRRSPKSGESGTRILCFVAPGIGNTLDAFPLLHALHRHFPQAQLTLACDPLSAPVAEACAAVNDVIVLEPSRNFWLTALRSGARLQNFDWAVAATGRCDSRLAVLTRVSNATLRVGFERRADRRSAYYTDPVALPDNPHEEHQIETLLRLMKPLGLINPTGWSVDLKLRVPDSAREYAAEVLAQPPYDTSRPFMLMNLSSSVRLNFREEDFIAIAGRVLGSTNFAIGLVAAPAEQSMAEEIAACMGSKRITAVEATGPLELAALLEHASLLFTPEGAAAHLAAAVGAPALVLWSEGLFAESHSRGRRHVFVHAEPGEKTIPVERAWKALQPFLAPE